MAIAWLLIDLLKGLEAEVPPPPRCHHAITYAKYDSDEAGWTDKLALQVYYNGKFFCFFIDDDDLADNLQRTIAFVKESLASPEIVASMQQGVAQGQYAKDS